MSGSLVALPAVATATVGATMSGIGFGSSGIVAGSVAAAIQSAIGNVSAGSLFATCQSIGMLGGWIGMLVMGVVFASICLACFIYLHRKSSSCGSSGKMES